MCAPPDCAERLAEVNVPMVPAYLEPRPPRVHAAARPHRELAARRLRAPHRRRDLAEAEPEHLAQHEDARSSGPSRSSSNRAAIDTESASSADRSGSWYGPVSSGSGNHGPTYSSRRTRAERSTSIEIRVTTADRNALPDAGSVGEAWWRSQVSSDRVLGLAHTAQDPVGDLGQQRPQLLELLGPGHASSSLKPCRHEG